MRLICLLLIVFLSAVGCTSTLSTTSQSTPASPEGGVELTLQLTSNSFAYGEMIPRLYTCDDEDLSPHLSWSEIPAGAASLALIADDPDAPVGTWVHWVLYNLPPDLSELPEGVIGIGVQGKNDFGRLGYGGPCPPRGKAHRYFFKLYALDTMLDLKEGATKARLLQAMEGHILSQGEWMGRYSR
jgi:Raf kinase inhibitor-like YbhB/YbcL family protein